MRTRNTAKQNHCESCRSLKNARNTERATALRKCRGADARSRKLAKTNELRKKRDGPRRNPEGPCTSAKKSARRAYSNAKRCQSTGRISEREPLCGEKERCPSRIRAVQKTGQLQRGSLKYECACARRLAEALRAAMKQEQIV